MSHDNKLNLDTELVRELANILKEADLAELEIEYEGLKLRASKPGPVVAAPQQVAPVQMMAAPQAVQAAPSLTPEAPQEAPQTDSVTGNAQTSPMVGTVYLSAEPGTAPFIAVGTTVNKGETLMLVEAMKTFNPVEATHSGTVTHILVEDGQPVEFGEALVVIE